MEFVRQCAIWSLFSDSNQTASLRNVKYNGETYQVVNHFFPFDVNDVAQWEISDSDIADTLKNDATNRFAAKWISEQSLDSDCVELLGVGMEIYQSLFKNFKNLETATFKVEHWDAGWWQIKKCLVKAGIGSDKFDKIDDLKAAIGGKIHAGAIKLEIISS